MTRIDPSANQINMRVVVESREGLVERSISHFWGSNLKISQLSSEHIRVLQVKLFVLFPSGHLPILDTLGW